MGSPSLAHPCCGLAQGGARGSPRGGLGWLCPPSPGTGWAQGLWLPGGPERSAQRGLSLLRGCAEQGQQAALAASAPQLCPGARLSACPQGLSLYGAITTWRSKVCGVHSCCSVNWITFLTAFPCVWGCLQPPQGLEGVCVPGHPVLLLRIWSHERRVQPQGLELPWAAAVASLCEQCGCGQGSIRHFLCGW